MLNLKLFLIFFTLLVNSVAFSQQQEQSKKIKIATGSIMQPYYSIGLKLCSFFTASSNIECEVISTSGSIENLQLLEEGKVDLAIAQSNLAVDAFNGKDYYHNKPPHLELRQLLTLHEEVFTIIAKDEDKIKVFADLAGKNVTNGQSISASNITYDSLRALYDIVSPVDIELSPEDYAKKLCNSEIDAVMLMVGHPNALVNYITNSCNVEFVTIENEQLTRLIENNKAFRRATLQKGTYPGIDEDQDTLAVSAIIVTTDKIDPVILSNFINYFKKNIDNFKNSNYILENICNDHFFSNFVLPVPEQLMTTK